MANEGALPLLAHPAAYTEELTMPKANPHAVQHAKRPTQPVQLDPTRCACPTGPTTLATFASEQLVEVRRVHLRGNGCGRPVEFVDPAAYVADMR